MSWVLNDAPVADQAQLCVLLGLANHADRYGRAAFPSRETLAEYARCSVRTVSRHLAALEAAGVIERGDQAHTAYLRGDRRPVVWDISAMQRGDTRGDNLTPRTPRGVTGDRHGVSPVTPEPSMNHPVVTPHRGVTTRARGRDPRRCDKHQHDDTPPPCGGCADARRDAERAEQAEQASRRRAEHAERVARSSAHWQAIERCGLCDHRGYLTGGAVCRHDPGAVERARQGAAAARAVLAGVKA